MVFILDDSKRQERMEKIRNNRKKRQEATQQQNGDTRQSEESVTGCPRCNHDSSDLADILLNPESVLDMDLLLSELSETETQFDNQSLLADGIRQDIGVSKNSVCNSCSHHTSVSSVPAVVCDSSPSQASTVSACSQTNTVSVSVSSQASPDSSQTPSSLTQSAFSQTESVADQWATDGRGFQGVAPHELPSDPQMYWTLTPEEKVTIKIVEEAFQVIGNSLLLLYVWINKCCNLSF